MKGLGLPDSVAFYANIQKALRPAIWLPVVRYPHRWEERWTIPEVEPEECLKAVGRAIEKLSAPPPAKEGEGQVQGEGGGGGASAPRFRFHLEKMAYAQDKGTGEATILCFSKKMWLDMVHVRLSKAPSGGRGTQAVALGYSTGIFPLTVPAAPLLSALCCWFPFYDNKLIRSVWMKKIREGMELGAEVVPRSGRYRI